MRRYLSYRLDPRSWVKPLSKDPARPLSPLRSDQVDVVYTWVDGADPAWRARYEAHAGGRLSEVDFSRRFASSGEILFSLRTLQRFFPEARRVFIVTDDQTLDLGGLPQALQAKITFVSHRQIIDPSYVDLPTFNSTVITSFLWRIPELSECFLYLNDDLFLGDRLERRHLVSPQGLAYSYLRPWNTARMARELTTPSNTNPWELYPINARECFLSAYDTEPNLAGLHTACLLHRSACEAAFQLFAEQWRGTYYSEKVRGPRSLAFGLLANWVGIRNGYQQPIHRGLISRRTRWFLNLDAPTVDALLREKPLFFCVNQAKDPELFIGLMERYLAGIE